MTVILHADTPRKTIRNDRLDELSADDARDNDDTAGLTS